MKIQNKHFEKNGKPFFPLVDTAWDLPARTSLYDVEYYIKTRKAQGFNAIVFSLISESDGLTLTNVNGDRPFVDDDFIRLEPNEKYFKHSKKIVELLEKNNMIPFIVPVWGDKWNKRSGAGPQIFTYENQDKIFNYWKFIGDLFKDYFFVWVLGGDKNPDNEQHREIIEKMVKGVNASASAKNLKTYHPKGGTSSHMLFPKADWLDFSIYQSGHTVRTQKGIVDSDWSATLDEENKFENYKNRIPSFSLQRNETKNANMPSMNGEPMYENIPLMEVNERGWVPIIAPVKKKFALDQSKISDEKRLRYIKATELDTLNDLFWTTLTGASGFFYGNNDIWQMTEAYDMLKTVEHIATREIDWRVAINSAASNHIGFWLKLINKIDFWNISNKVESISSLHDLEKMPIASITGTKKIIFVPRGNLKIELVDFDGKYEMYNLIAPVLSQKNIVILNGKLVVPSDKYPYLFIEEEKNEAK